ncbi:MAG TPA: ATPase, T2SS/T4P/T4SS family [Tepidisphaeraceae bacterium]|nr:ATPase, T2SS/T4P/T4SS family [Tepidisphaeraceae bacterium]
MGLAFLAQVQVGGYVSVWKAIPVLLVLLLWARLLTWVDKDTIAAHLPRLGINAAFTGGMILAFALFFLLPTFLIAFPVLLLIMGIEAGVYLGMRSKQVGLRDLKDQFNDWIASFKGEKKVKELPNQVQIINKSGAMVPPPEAEAPERPAYDALQNALIEPLRKNAEQIDIAPAETGALVKYSVDGVAYRGAAFDRANGGVAVGMLKGAAGLDVNDRRKPQRGALKLGADGRRTEFRIDTAGTTAGEYVRLMAEPKKRHDFRLDTLGFTAQQKQLLGELIQDRTGLVIVSAPKGQGLTSALYAVLRGHDAFLEHIHTVERAPDIDLEGITQNKLAANASAADEQKLVNWVISQEPDVLLVSKVEDPRTASELIRFAGDRERNRRVYVGMQANSTFEALAAWRKLVGDDRKAVENLKLIINGRVLRRLCNACKVGYTPDPNTLRKLGMDPDKSTTLFQARSQPLRDQKGNPIPCEFCKDLRFKGRTGVFEFFHFDDEARNVIAAAGASANTLKQVFRKQRGKFLQEEALGLVEKGDTSVQEVLRVLKGGDAAAPAEAGEAAQGAPVRV